MPPPSPAARRFYRAFYQWTLLTTPPLRGNAYRTAAAAAALHTSSARQDEQSQRVRTYKRRSRSSIIIRPNATAPRGTPSDGKPLADYDAQATDSSPFRIRKHSFDPVGSRAVMAAFNAAPIESSQERPFTMIAANDWAVRYRSEYGIMVECAVEHARLPTLKWLYGPELKALKEQTGARIEVQALERVASDGKTLHSILIAGGMEEVRRAWDEIRPTTGTQAKAPVVHGDVPIAAAGKSGGSAVSTLATDRRQGGGKTVATTPIVMLDHSIFYRYVATFELRGQNVYWAVPLLFRRANVIKAEGGCEGLALRGPDNLHEAASVRVYSNAPLKVAQIRSTLERLMHTPNRSEEKRLDDVKIFVVREEELLDEKAAAKEIVSGTIALRGGIQMSRPELLSQVEEHFAALQPLTRTGDLEYVRPAGPDAATVVLRATGIPAELKDLRVRAAELLTPAGINVDELLLPDVVLTVGFRFTGPQGVPVSRKIFSNRPYGTFYGLTGCEVFGFQHHEGWGSARGVPAALAKLRAELDAKIVTASGKFGFEPGSAVLEWVQGPGAETWGIKAESEQDDGGVEAADGTPATATTDGSAEPAGSQITRAGYCFSGPSANSVAKLLSGKREWLGTTFFTYWRRKGTDKHYLVTSGSAATLAEFKREIDSRIARAFKQLSIEREGLEVRWVEGAEELWGKELDDRIQRQLLATQIKRSQRPQQDGASTLRAGLRFTGPFSEAVVKGLCTMKRTQGVDARYWRQSAEESWAVGTGLVADMAIFRERLLSRVGQVCVLRGILSTRSNFWMEWFEGNDVPSVETGAELFSGFRSVELTPGVRNDTAAPVADAAAEKASPPSSLNEVSTSKAQSDQNDTTRDPDETAAQLAASVRTALRALTHPVVVITTHHPSQERKGRKAVPAANTDSGGPTTSARGVTVSSFTTVTLSPQPIVSFNLKLPSRTWDALRGSQHFAVHLLSASPEGAAIAHAFTQPYERGHEPFLRLQKQGVSVKRAAFPDAPWLERAGAVLAFMSVRLLEERCLPVGDHMVVLAEVERCDVLEEGVAGLSYAEGKYRVHGQAVEMIEMPALEEEIANGAVGQWDAETAHDARVAEDGAADEGALSQSSERDVLDHFEAMSRVDEAEEEEEPVSEHDAEAGAEQTPERASELAEERGPERRCAMEEEEDFDLFQAPDQDPASVELEEKQTSTASMQAPGDHPSDATPTELEGTHDSQEPVDVLADSPSDVASTSKVRAATPSASKADSGYAYTARNVKATRPALKPVPPPTFAWGLAPSNSKSFATLSSRPIVRRRYSSSARRATLDSPTTDRILDPAAKTTTVADFLGIPDNNRPWRSPRVRGLVKARATISESRRLLDEAFELSPEQATGLELKIAANERQVTRKLAWNAARELRLMLDRGRVDAKRAGWLESAVEAGQAVLLADARRAKGMLDRGELGDDGFQLVRERVEADYRVLEVETRRLRGVVEEEGEGEM